MENENKKKEYTTYDSNDYFQEECMPCIKELIKKCHDGNIPFFCTFAISNKDDKTQYYSDGIMTGSSSIRLYDDRIKHHMMVAGGCVAQPPNQIDYLDTDAIYGAFANVDVYDEVPEAKPKKKAKTKKETK